MFVYGVCVGPTGQFERVLNPSLRRFGLGPVLVRTKQRSIFDAYNSILDEAVSRWPNAEGVVLAHEDLEIRDPSFEVRLRDTLALPDAGVVGVVGGAGHTDNWWWNSPRKYGYVEHAVYTHDFRRGTHDVDTVDGLLMVVSPRAAREIRLDGHRYPGFHGYDSELCAIVRAYGMRILVTDLNVFHDCNALDWSRPELRWAMYEWMLRWRRPAQLRTRLVWRTKRRILRLLSASGYSMPPDSRASSPSE